MMMTKIECPLYDSEDIPEWEAEAMCQFAKQCLHRYIKTGRPAENTHRLYWPKREYQRKVERQFRELAVNKVKLCLGEHALLHMVERPPRKPSREEMMAAIQQESE
jgi:hypothetical protein